MSSKLRGIIEVLCDGNSYSQSELQKLARLNKHQTKQVIAFLSKYGFIEMSNENSKLKITDNARKFFSKSK